MNITVAARDVATYETKLMTQNEANKLDDLRSRLKSHFEKYKEFSTQIQQELDDADAPQEDYDAEAETVRLTDEEVGAAKTILKTIFRSLFFVPLPDKVFIYTYILLSKDVSSARLY